MKARQAEFDNIPRITVTKGEDFFRYVDLSQYKTSHHTLSELSVEISFNAIKSKGLEIIKNGLVLVLSGRMLEDVSIEDDNILVVVQDDDANQTTLSIKIGTLEPDPEVPDARPQASKFLCSNW